MTVFQVEKLRLASGANYTRVVAAALGWAMGSSLDGT